MRVFVSILAICLATSAQAKDMSFVCSTEKDAISDLGDIHIKVEGIISQQGDKRLLEYRGEFLLGCNEDWADPGQCWAATPEKFGRVVNKTPYNPRVYKGHRKFELNLDSDNAYGSFDFIFPKENLIKGKKKFTAHMILTYINDHFGDSVRLNCEVTKKYKFPENFVDLRACAKKIQSMASTVNICGNDDTFEARGCKQEALGQSIQCKGLTFAPGRGCVMKITMGPMCEKNISSEITRDERGQ